MKNLFLTLFLILAFSSNVQAGTAQVNNVAQLGGATNSAISGITAPLNSTSLLSFMVGVNGNTQGNKLIWTKTGQTTQAQYRVPAGKTLVVFGFYCAADTAQVYIVSFGHDTATFTNNSAVAGTDIYYANSSVLAENGVRISLTTAAVWYPMSIQFAANMYPFVRFTNTGPIMNCTFYGQEI